LPGIAFGIYSQLDFDNCRNQSDAAKVNGEVLAGRSVSAQGQPIPGFYFLDDCFRAVAAAKRASRSRVIAGLIP